MSLPTIDGDPAQGDPDGIRALAQIFVNRSSDLTERSSRTSSASAELGSTESETTGALVARTSLLTQRFSEASTACLDAARILNDYASGLDSLKALAARRLQTASDAYDLLQRRRHEAMSQSSEALVGWAIPWDQAISSSLYLSDRGYLTRWQSAIDDYRIAARQYNGLQADRKSLDDSTARSLRDISLVAAVGRGGAVSAGGLAAATSAWAGDLSALTAASIASLGDPKTIREVWNALSPAQREKLTSADPLVIGNLDGIPLRDRVTANRINIQNEIARRRSEIADLQKQIDKLSARPTRGSSALISVLRARIAEHETYVSSYQDLLEKKWEWKDENRQPVSQVGVNVVVFDPTSSAIGSYYGPIDPQTGDIPAWVKHTAVSVPGTGANMADFSESRAQDLYLASGYDSAVFQWAGGPFPQTIPEATQASYSEKLAPRLASFVDAVNRHRESPNRPRRSLAFNR